MSSLFLQVSEDVNIFLAKNSKQIVRNRVSRHFMYISNRRHTYFQFVCKQTPHRYLPVSYTHLDVYKRQSCKPSKYSRRKKKFIKCNIHDSSAIGIQTKTKQEVVYVYEWAKTTIQCEKNALNHSRMTVKKAVAQHQFSTSNGPWRCVSITTKTNKQRRVIHI